MTLTPDHLIPRNLATVIATGTGSLEPSTAQLEQEWILDTDSMSVREDLRIHVLAVVQAQTDECLALSLQGALTPTVLPAVLRRLIREHGQPSRIQVSSAMRDAMLDGLDSVLCRFHIQIAPPTRAVRSHAGLFENLYYHLQRRCGNLPRHFALLTIRRAAEYWRHSRNRKLHRESAIQNQK